ncbi:MAG: hypothetical protein ACPF9F_02820 [Acholeplasmataceae bacterium]
MTHWYQSYATLKLVMISMIWGMYVHMDIFLGQTETIQPYLNRYLEGLYPIIMSSVYLYFFHHPKRHMIYYLMKKNSIVKWIHIISDFKVMMYMIIFLCIHILVILFNQASLSLVLVVITETFKYTLLTLLTFQITDQLIYRVLIQLTFLTMYLYSHTVQLILPYVILNKHTNTLEAYVVVLGLMLILICLRWLKYLRIRVNP